MSKRLAVLTSFLILASMGIGASVISSYGSVTGLATVESAISVDIIGSSNDLNYTVSAYQGEMKYSPQIKLVNRANVPINISIIAQILPGSAGVAGDVSIDIVDDTKNHTIQNISVPTSDTYFYARHIFAANATPGSYMFQVAVIPI